METAALEVDANGREHSLGGSTALGAAFLAGFTDSACNFEDFAALGATVVVLGHRPSPLAPVASSTEASRIPTAPAGGKQAGHRALGYTGTMSSNDSEQPSQPEPRKPSEFRPGELTDPSTSSFFDDQPVEPAEEPTPPARPIPEQLPLGIELPEPEDEIELEEAAVPQPLPEEPASDTPEPAESSNAAVTITGAVSSQGVVLVPAAASDAVVIVAPTPAPEPARPPEVAPAASDSELSYVEEYLNPREPQPGPETTPEPEPATAPQPEPEPAVVPEPEPPAAPEPAPEVVPEPEPSPLPEPVAAPGPESEPAPQPEPEPEPPAAPAPEPQPAAVPEPEPVPAKAPEPEPAAVPKPEPEPAASTEPVPGPPSAPTAAPEPEPVAAPAPAATPPSSGTAAPLGLPATPGPSASAAATGDLRSGGVSGIRLRPLRNRLPRRPLVPRWVLPAAGVTLLAIVVIAGLVVLFSSAASVKVPQLVGLDIGVARVNLQRAGLSATISEQRFSTLARGTVLAQQPRAGTTLSRGETVALVISAGTEAFSLPDVTGEGLELAQGTLQSRGLTVLVQTQQSSSASGTVLSSEPLPGAQVHTGDTVRLTVASTSTPAAQLSSFNMSSANIAIDPEPVSPGQLDTTMDVARRLQSLIQAAGGKVFVTRSVVETNLPADVRAQRVAESTATALIVISAAPTGNGGIAVYSPTYAAYALGASSHALAQQVSSKLAGEGLTAPLATIVPDAVLLASKGPAVKVKLGSFSSPGDVTNFQDAAWADEVARGIYLGLGTSVGK